MLSSTNEPERASEVRTRRHTAQDIIASVRISDVYGVLAGNQPRRTGTDTWRAPATWRGGDGFNVSLDDSRGVYHDFVDDSGGGVLDLVQRIRGGTRQDALRWVADFAGIPLNDQPLSPEDRRRWARERQEIEQHLTDAQYWRRAVVKFTDELLDSLKAALFDPTLPQPALNEIYNVECVLARLQHLDGRELVNEYLESAKEQPFLCAHMVAWAKTQERIERAALLEFLRVSEPAA
jgi:hypothetical protein